ncbi:MAG: ABC transporter permease [Chitinispirillia bacterium]|nr:ABC transporter permease [Chitinispirillia bacterium]MCL2242631.1 ABC transporter permease [Chitinispirillia bacterium]
MTGAVQSVLGKIKGIMNTGNKPTGKFSLSVFLVVLVFLYLPLAILILNSFNASKSMSWEGFSLRWYNELFFSPSWVSLWKTFGNSAVAALTSATAATVVGTLGAIGLYWYRFRAKKAIQIAAFMPMLIPEIIIGVSLAMLFASTKLPMSLFTVILAHTTFNIPFVLLVVMARLESFDFMIIEAAYDLGATEYQALSKVILPAVFPGIIAAFLIAVTLSLDDFVVAFFVAGPGGSTLPVYLESRLKLGIPPVINALSVVIIAGTVVLAFLSRNIVKYMFHSNK